MTIRANQTPTEKELAQLRQDVARLARYLIDHQGAKPELVQIIERNSPTGLETRPHRAPEQRMKVA